MSQKIDHSLLEIGNQVNLLVTTSVAKHLAPFVASASPAAQHATRMPNHASHSTPPPCNDLAPSPSSVDKGSCEPRSLANESPNSATLNTSENNDGSSVSTIEVNTSQFTYSKELLTSAELTPIYVKSRNRRNFAALLVQRLFDVPTRMKSNVAGRGKEKLDPEIMKYVKAKTFEYYECHPSEVKEEWNKCVVSIDEKSHALKKLKGNKMEKENLNTTSKVCDSQKLVLYETGSI